MKKENKIKFAKGFTLIELLVVVVIIGILASIALPQYKKAVLKSKFATVKQNAKVLWEANQRYYMVNGEYTGNINDLDVQVTSSNKVQYAITKHGVAYGTVVKSNTGVSYYIYGSASVLCAFYSTNSSVFNMLDEFCKQETNNGKRECNSAMDCYYYYNKKS